MDNYLTYIDPLTNWLGQHPHWAGIFTFLISFSESLAIVGSIVPGSITMTAIGVLIGTSVIPGIPTFIWAVLGAIAGDSASYYLGYYYSDRISEYWPFRKYPHIIESGKVFFNQHGGKSVFLGRFFGPLRSIIPLIAGMMNMPNIKFLSANVTSAILWSMLYILPGVLIGAAATELSPQLASKFFIYTIVILCVIWIGSWIIKILCVSVQRYVNSHLINFWRWMKKHPKLTALASKISNPKHPQDHKQIALLSFAILFLCLFVLVAYSAYHKGFITYYDKPAFHFLQSIRLPVFDSLFMFFTFIGDKKTLLPLLFSVFAYLAYKHNKWEAVHWLSNGIIASLMVYVLKFFINLPRPQGLVQIRHGASFPSGHTTFSVALFGFLFYLIAKNTPASIRRFVILPGALLVTCIGFSRLYLGMHWLSDVIGSVLIAGAILMLHIMSYRRMTSSKVKIKPLIALSCAVLTIFNSFFMYKNFNAAIQGSQLKHSMQLSEFSSWWDNKLLLPTHRKNRFGIDVAPLNIQWAMPINDIRRHLESYGWQSKDKTNLSNRVTELLRSDVPHLSLFRKLYNNRPPKLLMTKDSKVIRLWQSNVRLKTKNMPLWIGTVAFINQEKSGISKNSIAEQKKIQDNYLPSKMLFEEISTLQYKKCKAGNLREIIIIK